MQSRSPLASLRHDSCNTKIHAETKGLTDTSLYRKSSEPGVGRPLSANNSVYHSPPRSPLSSYTHCLGVITLHLRPSHTSLHQILARVPLLEEGVLPLFSSPQGLPHSRQAKATASSFLQSPSTSDARRPTGCCPGRAGSHHRVPAGWRIPGIDPSLALSFVSALRPSLRRRAHPAALLSVR